MNEPPLRGYSMNQSSHLNKVLPAAAAAAARHTNTHDEGFPFFLRKLETKVKDKRE